MTDEATQLEHEVIMWALGTDGGGKARVGRLDLEVLPPAPDDAGYLWEVTSDGILLADGPSTDEEQITDAGAARAAAERWAMDWIHGVGRFDEGFKLEGVRLGWLAEHYGVEDSLRARGYDPATPVTLIRAEGEQPTGSLADPTASPSLWATDCDAMADIEFPWEPNNDAQAARLVDAWDRRERLAAAARASSSTEETRRENENTLAVIREGFEEEPAEPEELEAPDRKPDHVRNQTLMALVPFSPEQQLALGEELAAKTIRMGEEREAAREAASKARKTMASLLDDATTLAERHKQGGDEEPRPHRLEYFVEEGIIVVRREDTGKQTDIRRMRSAELDEVRQGELPLEAAAGELPAGDDEDTGTPAPQDTEPPPFEIAVGLDLVSTGGSGLMMRVVGDEGVDDDGVHRWAIHKLTKSRELWKSGKPSVVSEPGLYSAYKPVEVPAAPEGPGGEA